VNEEIQQYYVTLTTVGKESDSTLEIRAQVYHQKNGGKVVLAKSTKPQMVKFSASFTLNDNLPRPFTVKRSSDGSYYVFEYAKPSEGVRWFIFRSTDYEPEQTKAKSYYCTKCRNPDKDERGKKLGAGITYNC
jgi:hypothetical protein